MDTWSGEIPHFSRKELACKGTGKVLMDIRFARALPWLRGLWGKPLIVNSCCRTPDHNAAVGGHPRSLHLTKNPRHPTHGTMAVDIRWWDWTDSDRLAFAQLAYKNRWSVGLHDSFIHLDRRSEIGLARAVFVYGRWSAPFKIEEVINDA